MTLKKIEPLDRSDARKVLRGAEELLDERQVDSVAVLLYSRSTGDMYIRTSRNFGRLEAIGAIEEIKMAMLNGAPAWADE